MWHLAPLSALAGGEMGANPDLGGLSSRTRGSRVTGEVGGAQKNGSFKSVSNLARLSMGIKHALGHVR